MDSFSPTTDVTVFYIQEAGALLFGLVFLFLYRQSRAVYFGLWAAGWVPRAIAAIFGFQLLRTAQATWLAPYAAFEFLFVVLLVSAARAGFPGTVKDWRGVLRLTAALPIFVALVYTFGLHARLAAYCVSHALALCFVYSWHFFELRRNSGLGADLFRASLLLLAAACLAHTGVLVYLYREGDAAAWGRYLHQAAYYDFLLHGGLAFSAMALWMERQRGRIRDLAGELDHLLREASHGLNLDRLTGLSNQAALAQRLEQPGGFDGVVAVCDMDHFKEVNDRYGHLVGDEILSNIGNLLRGSIRHEDEAFRWGGDEFVILFHNQRAEVARKRMAGIEARLREFRVRGLGALPISFSWGTADAFSRPLRDALDEADRDMYALKRTRAGNGAPREHPPARWVGGSRSGLPPSGP